MSQRMMSGLASDLTERWGRSYETLIGHVVGLTLAVAGLGILASGVVDIWRGGPDVAVLLIVGALVSVVGLLGWRFTKLPRQIRILDVFVTVTLAWVVLMFVGALPYVLTGWIPNYDDAMFESISGFTTTGATVLRPIEGTGPGVLFWRAVSQWMGGMGVIVLVVAVLPTVGSGGMSLLEAEAPGPTGERLTPRVRQTARRLWAVYIGFTIVLALAYMVAGMGLYDGVAHSFTTVSTGGFSPYNSSLGHFDSGCHRVDRDRGDVPGRDELHVVVPTVARQRRAAAAFEGVPRLLLGRWWRWRRCSSSPTTPRVRSPTGSVAPSSPRRRSHRRPATAPTTLPRGPSRPSC